MDQLFSNKDIWSGGSFQLFMKLTDASDASARALLTALWSAPCLEGCYLWGRIEPDAQPRVPPSELILEDGAVGIATFPNGLRCACGNYDIRFEDDGGRWIEFYVPHGALGTIYPVGGYPFARLKFFARRKPAPVPDVDRSWLEIIKRWWRGDMDAERAYYMRDHVFSAHSGPPRRILMGVVDEPPEQKVWLSATHEWFRAIAEHVYATVPFAIAVIGFEALFLEMAEEVQRGIPEERWDGVLLPVGGRLAWYPPTTSAAQYTAG